MIEEQHTSGLLTALQQHLRRPKAPRTRTVCLRTRPGSTNVRLRRDCYLEGLTESQSGGIPLALMVPYSFFVLRAACISPPQCSRGLSAANGRGDRRDWEMYVDSAPSTYSRRISVVESDELLRPTKIRVELLTDAKPKSHNTPV